MAPYVRPSIDAPVFRDAGGAVIDYGNRWHGSPPEDTYSVDTHPERFAPLHRVADALIAYLGETYDVDIAEGPETVMDLMRCPSHDVVRSVLVRPNDPTCASLTLVYTAYPGIFMHAGLLHDFHYPVCGCDACDSDWVGEADDLEQQVLATAEGHYRETIGRGRRPWVGYVFTHPDGGGSSGQSSSQDLPTGRLERAAPTLRDLPAGWGPWPRAT